MDIKQALTEYLPCCEQEQTDRAILLQALECFDDIFTRQNQLAHFTASCWIVNPKRTKVLMAYHNLYRSWAWTGGHADGERDLCAVALREAREETGLTEICALSSEIFSLEVLTVEGHRKRGKYVAPHLHFNVTYLLCADDTAPLCCKPDENSAVQWFSFSDAIEASCEPYLQKIYEKLNEKVQKFVF